MMKEYPSSKDGGEDEKRKNKKESVGGESGETGNKEGKGGDMINANVDPTYLGQNSIEEDDSDGGEKNDAQTHDDSRTQKPTSAGSHSEASQEQGAMSSSSTSSANMSRFPQKLMRILDSEAYEDIFAWSRDGDAIVIHKPYDLIDKVLTIHFGAKEDIRFDSFLRKLYRWGFSKRVVENLDDDEGEHTYCHKHFQRGDYSSCSKIVCASKPSSRRKTPRRSATSNETRNLQQLLQVGPMSTARTNGLVGLAGGLAGGVVVTDATGATSTSNGVMSTSSIASAATGRTAMANGNLDSLHGANNFHSSIPSQMNLRHQFQFLQQQVNATRHSLPLQNTTVSLQQHLSIQQQQMQQQGSTTNNSMNIFQPLLATRSSPPASTIANLGFHNPLQQRALESSTVIGQEIARIEQENNLLSELSSNLDSNIEILRQQRSSLTMQQQDLPAIEAARLRLLSLERQAQLHAASTTIIHGDLPINPPAAHGASTNINMLSTATRERTGISASSSTTAATATSEATIPRPCTTNVTSDDTRITKVDTSDTTHRTQNQGREIVRGLDGQNAEGNRHHNNDYAQFPSTSQRRRLR